MRRIAAFSLMVRGLCVSAEDEEDEEEDSEVEEEEDASALHCSALSTAMPGLLTSDWVESCG